MRRLFAASVCLLWMVQSVHATSDDATIKLRANLGVLEQTLDDPTTHTLAPAGLIAKAGLQDYVALNTVNRFTPSRTPPKTSHVPVTGLAMDIRLGMTILTQSYGASENKIVLEAQGEVGRQALTLMSGEATLTDIRRLLQSTRLQYVHGQGPLTLDVPLIIWKGAQLRLLPGETLSLNRTTGAIILNFGHIQVDRATIISVGEENPHNEKFRPFVVTSGGGSAQLDQARIIGLGFGHLPKFSGFSVMLTALFPTQYPTQIFDSLFQDVVSLATSGTSDVTIQGNIFRDMRGSAVTMTRSRHARVISNLFTGRSQTNAIRIEHGSVGAVIAGNVILNGDRAGVVIRHNSHHSLVLRNIIWAREGGGILLSHSECSRVISNLVMDNGQKGIEVRSSKESLIEANIVVSNHSAGIWVSAQENGTQTFVTANILGANGTGIASATGATIVLEKNDFTAQFPQFLGGDLALQSRHIAQNIDGHEKVILTSAGRQQNTDLYPECPQYQASY
ncbi:MAG: poly(beta-D-mannuronate) C5 epimerase [Paracoccaceae bacterium]|jgi:poly(beta-D-mannuronate) C5 epimerase